MTNKEAIKILRSLYNVQSLDTLTQEEMTAVAMAIKSLEAWGSLKAEIEELPSGLAYYIKGTSVLPAVERGSLRELIDEHLRRIEE